MSKEKIDLEQVEYSNDGGSTSVEIIDHQQMHIKYNTHSLENGYYTTFLGIWNPRDISTSEVLQFEIETKEELYMNLNLILSAKENIKLKNESYVLFQAADQETIKIIPVEDGTFYLAKGVKGTLTLPLQNLESNSDLTMESIGLIFVLEQEKETELIIDKMQFAKAPLEVQTLGNNCSLVGTKSLLIPSYGEYTYEYSLLMESLEGKDTKYSLLTQSQGISMSEDGKLTITSHAECEEITFQIVVDSTYVYETSVNLVSHWYVSEEETMFGIPTESFVVSYTGHKMISVLQYDSWIQAGGIALFLTYICFYLGVVKKHKKHSERIID